VRGDEAGDDVGRDVRLVAQHQDDRGRLGVRLREGLDARAD
jgi:hypothetical protein